MLSDLTPEEISYLSTSFALAISKGLDDRCVRVLCSFFVNVVGTLNLVLSQRTLCQDRPHERLHDKERDKEHGKEHDKERNKENDKKHDEEHDKERKEY
jgi:hypothetical protein